MDTIEKWNVLHFEGELENWNEDQEKNGVRLQIIHSGRTLKIIY